MEIDNGTQKLVEVAEKFQGVIEIKTADEYSNAASMLKTIKAHVKVLEDKRKELVEPYIKGKAALDEFFKKPQEKCKAIIDKINSAMNEFNRKEAARVKEEQDRLELERKKEEEKLAKAAEKARAKGDVFKADEIEMKIEDIKERPVAIVQSSIPVVSTKRRENWNFEITDLNKVPREFLKADEVKIGAYVREQKANAKIEGIKIFPTYTNY